MSYLSQFKRSLAVAKKNLRIYYLKGPVIIFGMLLPLFFFLSFWMGREMAPLAFGTGLVVMALWFTSTSISPVITPWETRTRTLERVLSSPISPSWLLLGDMLASAFIGLAITLVSLALPLLLLNVNIVYPTFLILGLIIASLCFSAIGVLMAALPTDTPSNVMMLSSLVKFPIIFISGIFIPIGKLPSWGQTISYLSPVTYLMDLTKWTFGGKGELGFFPSYNLFFLAGFLIAFFALAVVFHKRTLPKRL
ncbi:MAG: ABC transporter permease [Thermoproteota archaeon]